MTEPALSTRSTLPRAILWSIFLGCSWTWCIGMFLPVLLVRDFGLAGWIVFAIPNVLGAAAVGFIRYPPGSEDKNGIAAPDVVVLHRRAMQWFSLVTIAFHFFFVFWFVTGLIGSSGIFLFLLSLLVVLFLGRSHPHRDLASAAAALAISTAAAFVVISHHSNLPVVLPSVPLNCPAPAALALLSPSIVLGFLLCPHLDLTLHRARLESPPNRLRLTFVLGFGAVFLALIFFSLFYAPALDHILTAGEDDYLTIIYRWAAVRRAIGVHIAIQAGLTVALHARALDTRGRASPLRTSPILFIVFAGMMILSITAAVLVNLSLPLNLLWLKPSAGELLYRSFLAFYALPFPAYAWAAWRSRTSARPPRLAAWLPSVILGLPLLALGFLANHYVAVPLAVALVLINPYLVPPLPGVPGARDKAQA